MAAMKLHGNVSSSSTMRVLACLYEKNIEFEFVSVDVRSGEHRLDHFLALNPFGQVPALEDGDLKLFESRAITQYIAQKHAEEGTPLTLTFSVEATATLALWMQVEAHQYDPVASKLVRELALKPMMGQTTNPEAVEELEAKLTKVLDIYEARLSRSQYLAGDRFTLADMHHLPTLHYLMGTPAKKLFNSRLNLNRWVGDVTTRPAWSKVLHQLQKQQIMDFMAGFHTPEWTWENERRGYIVLSGPRKQVESDEESDDELGELDGLDECAHIAIIGAIEGRCCLNYAKRGEVFDSALSIQQSIDRRSREYNLLPLLESISKDGLTTERYYPFERSRPRTSEIPKKNIPLYHIDNIRRLEFTTVAEIQELVSEILQGPVVGSFRVCQDLSSIKGDEIYYARGKRVLDTFPNSTSDSDGSSNDSEPLNHAVQVVGYSFRNGELILRYQDSEGPYHL